jgi:lipopolysaccharide/colanic/teichoic acid biosynthesis glycosyltransferase/UDP-N-acetylglucosamine 2-epimerase
MIVAPNTCFVRLFLAEQIRMLVRKDLDVQLVCAPDENGSDDLADLPCVVRFVSIAREISIARDCAALGRLVSLLSQFKPDMLHVHGPKPSLLASVAGKLCGVPVRLHTIHGLRSDGLRGMRRSVVRAMERLTFACSTRCFAVSHSLADHVVEEKLLPAQTVAVLGYGSWAGIDLERFKPGQHSAKAAELRKAWGIAADALLITYIGRLAADKGLHTLAEAWQTVKRHNPQARLLIAGPRDATDPVDAAVMEMLRSDPAVVLEDRFTQDVPALLAASNLFAQPSLREGLGIAALEAAAMELPVIASRVTGLIDTVREKTSGLLVPPQDGSALADAIEFLLEHPEARESFGKNGRRLVQKRFAQADVLQLSMQMYTSYAHAPVRTGLWNSFGKRLFDCTLALLLLVAASPLMLLVAAAIWIFLSRPVLFTQERGGLYGLPIRIFKFRTMRVPKPGQTMIGTDDERAHWLGLLLRKLSLDELPQLFNVVRGEMSLIGPRPLLLSYVPRYTQQQRHRHDVLPGITGLAQVKGRNNVSWAQRFELDLWYVRHRNAWLDLTILFLTVQRLFRPRDISATGNVSMPEFMGDTHQAHS